MNEGISDVHPERPIRKFEDSLGADYHGSDRLWPYVIFGRDGYGYHGRNMGAVGARLAPAIIVGRFYCFVTQKPNNLLTRMAANMELLHISDKDELVEALSRYRGCLFRGQTRQHHSKSDEFIFTTSFFRKGCHPETMIKWTFYAERLLRRFFDVSTDRNNPEDRQLLYQAFLQHYGWRSFFVDATDNAAVAAWFASKEYAQTTKCEMTEDCHEVGVLLANTAASYIDHQGRGFLYVICEEKLVEYSIRLQCLSDECADNGHRYRFNAQHAWLLGPAAEGIPAECVITLIDAPAEVLREYASEAGFSETKTLFPDSTEDPCLNVLLSIPRVPIRRPGNNKIAVYRRQLDLPDYHYEATKIHKDHHAFYSGGTIGEKSQRIDSTILNAFMLTAPEFVMFGRRGDNEAVSTPLIASLLEKHTKVGIEIDSLIRLPDWTVNSIYSKGLFLSRTTDGLIDVADLIVSHPGTLMLAAGANSGWRYKIDQEGRWVRIPHPEDCPCRNDALHDHHLTILLRVEELLQAT